MAAMAGVWLFVVFAAAEAPLVPAGFARRDITPSYPVMLSGFGFRRSESEGVGQRIWAKAMALGASEPFVLVTVDTLGCPWAIREELLRRLAPRGIRGERFAIAATHTHTAPMLEGTIPTLFGQPIVPDRMDRIRRYTREFTDSVEKVVLAALADRRPARLGWGAGSAGFATNRRAKGGPVDHDLPVLVARDGATGDIRGLWASYACHAVTLSHNKVGGDWPGHAQQAMEDAFPGSIALVSAGCGADSNPDSGVTGDKVEIASRQGMEIAREVARLAKGNLTPLGAPTAATLELIDLPLGRPQPRDVLEARALKQDYIGHHSRVQLERLARGEKPLEKIRYPVQTWAFGNDLAMVFLAGEVVADYSLRLKRELDSQRLWVNGYANDLPCYIPSERVLREGGYEGGGAMTYYDLPAPLQPGLENRIVAAVNKPLAASFKAPARGADALRTGGTRPYSPEQARALWRAPEGTRLELVAAEPLVQSPVAIDFAHDGSLWVAEMRDYPSGLGGDYQPGGAVRRLTDTDGDGVFDRSTVFLEGIPFPTGVTAWRDGVLVCAAPDILFARDTNGDGKADVVEKLYSGFGTGNYQARVNSLAPGLDGWLHGSCGLFGGSIRCHKTGKVAALGDRDFRIRPDSGELEPATGRTQQGRVRDAIGRWFGCDNSTLAWHLVLPDEYLRRNPAIRHGAAGKPVPADAEASLIIPAGGVQLFKLSGPSGTVTSACGLCLYDDTLLGPGLEGSILTCEPVHHVVHRMELRPDGHSVSGHRPAGEKGKSFLASADPWARPVQVKAGPDGCLYVVDMYRYLIEHPRWIPAEDLLKIDTRAGCDLGRIYRLRPEGKPPRRVPSLKTATTSALVDAMAGPGAAARDMAMQELLWRADPAATEPLRQLAQGGAGGPARAQALATLALLIKLDAPAVARALEDRHPAVRTQGARLAEPLAPDESLRDRLIAATGDQDPSARLQAVFSLGAWSDDRAAAALGKAARRHADDPHLVSAALSGTRAGTMGAFAEAALAGSGKPPELFMTRLTEAVAGTRDALARLGVGLLAANGDPADRMGEAGRFLDAMAARGTRPKELGPVFTERLAALVTQARGMAEKQDAPEAGRTAAVTLLGRNGDESDEALLGRLLGPSEPFSVRQAALRRLAGMGTPGAGKNLLEAFRSLSPAMRLEALNALAGKADWARMLLDKVAQGEVPAGELGAIVRQRLLDHRDKSLAALAAKALGGNGAGDRAKVTAQYQAALGKTAGDTARGREMFRKHCATCHRLEDQGNAVGPDLRVVAGKTAGSLVQEILDPNRNMDSRYMVYAATLKTGQTVAGIIATENATAVTLRQSDGKDKTLLRTELEALETTGKSLMPEGLEREIAPGAMADILAYLARQETPAKAMPGNTPGEVPVAASGARLPASAAEIRGGSIVFEREHGNIGYWHGAGDTARWRVRAPAALGADVWLEYACARSSAGNRLVVEVGESRLEHTVNATGEDWSFYSPTRIGRIRLPAGESVVTVRPEGEMRGALADLRAVVLTEPGGAPPALAPGDSVQPQSPGELVRALVAKGGDNAVIRKLVEDRGDWAADMIQDMTNSLAPGQAEYRMIPHIWRVAIAQGKKGDPKTVLSILRVSLPEAEADMRDWQAVVLGGGLINGSTLAGRWPHQEYQALLARDPGLRPRWTRAIGLAFAMADNPKVPTGTRYDALRMAALGDRSLALALLARHLRPGTDDELVMGAASGLGDMAPSEDAAVSALLLEALPRLNETNLGMALGALVRTPGRSLALLEAVRSGKVAKAKVGHSARGSLLQSGDPRVKALAAEVFK